MESSETDPWRGLPGGQRALISMGTLNQGEQRRVLKAAVGVAIDQVRRGELDAVLVAMAGASADELGFGRMPDPVRCADWLDMPATVRGASVVVGHAGSGISLVCAARGRPQVAVPHAGEQPNMAARLVARGVAVVVPPPELSHARLDEALSNAMRDLELHANVEALCDETAAMPDPSAAMAELERMFA